MFWDEAWVAQRRFDLSGSVLVQLGGLFGDDGRPKSRCGRLDRHRDGPGRRMASVWVGHPKLVNSW